MTIVILMKWVTRIQYLIKITSYITIINEMNNNNTILFVILEAIKKFKLNKCHVNMVY
jgi:hypothetical protein